MIYILNKEKIIDKCKDNFTYINEDDIRYESIVKLHCVKHGSYNKTVRQILYKNPNCPECTRLSRNKKLSDIGKTKIGDKNNFYGKTHSDESKLKMSIAVKNQMYIRRPKISKTIMSKQCQDKIKATNIRRYGVEHFTNKAKYKETCMIKYGVDSPFKDPVVKEKIKNTMIKNHGVDIALKSAEVREKAKNTMLIRYGVDNAFKMPATRAKAKYNCANNISKIETEIYDICKSYYIDTIIRNDRSAIGKELDVYLPDIQLAIEYNGNYWHSDNCKEHSYHLDKSVLCKNKGIRLIHIYEFEDFYLQMTLLTDLLNGIDKYNKTDFNKNNLIIENIPEPYPYSTSKGTVYAAGEIKEVDEL